MFPDTGFLGQMADSSRMRLEAARTKCSESAMMQIAMASPRPKPLRLHPAGFDLIAELKLRSPASGKLGAADEDVRGRVEGYARAGAVAVSVLTEPDRFDGAMVHLETAAVALAPFAVPAMRKDFLVDPYQVMEARAAGAGGVLVILRMVPRETITALLECARRLGLFVLLEAFDQHDLQLMHDFIKPAPDSRLDPPILAGLNCRDLATLRIVPSRLLELVHLLPGTVPRVAESGVMSAEDAARIAAAGYQLALVGSALMQGGDPRSLAAAMLYSGRRAAAVAVPNTQSLTLAGPQGCS